MASPLVESNAQVFLVALEDMLEGLLCQYFFGDTVKATYTRIILFIVDALTIDYEIQANIFLVITFVIHQPELDVEVISILVLDSAA